MGKEPCLFFLTADYDEYVRNLPDSVRPYLDNVLDWDNKGVDKDLEKIADLVTDHVKIKLLPGLEIPDEDMKKIKEDFPDKEWYKLVVLYYLKLLYTHCIGRVF